VFLPHRQKYSLWHHAALLPISSAYFYSMEKLEANYKFERMHFILHRRQAEWNDSSVRRTRVT